MYLRRGWCSDSVRDSAVISECRDFKVCIVWCLELAMVILGTVLGYRFGFFRNI